MPYKTIFDSKNSKSIAGWRITDDAVMGGCSSSKISLSPTGQISFYGTVSLENNGGFSMTKYQCTKMIDTLPFERFVLRVKGDGKNYQFRAKTYMSDDFSYIHIVTTKLEWQIIEIPFTVMYPTYRGKKLPRANYEGNFLSEIGFLIGNKRNEDFNLIIDWIKLK